jgi:hypothetical protein
MRRPCGSAANVLNDVQVRYAGGFGAAAAVYDKGGPLLLSNSVVSNSNTTGIRLEQSTAMLTAVTFTNNNGAAVSTDLASNPMITGETATSFTNNSTNGLVLDGGPLVASSIWNNPDIVYSLGASVTVPLGVTLTVGAGQVIKAFGGVNLTVDGTLTAQGTATAPVVFTSLRDDGNGGDTNNDGANSAPGRGDWQGLQLNADSTNNVLDHVQVLFAGGFGGTAGIYDKGGPLTLTNSVVSNTNTNGVRLEQSTATLTTVTFTNNNGAAVSMDLASNPTITGETATNIANNANNGLIMDGGSLLKSLTWNNPDIVYTLGASVTVPTGMTLTISAGQVIKAFGGVGLTVDGTLTAQGTAAAPVVFTSVRDDTSAGDTNNDGANSAPGRGDWVGLIFNADSTNNVLDRVQVQYAAGFGGVAGIADHGGSLNVTNSALNNNNGPPISADGSVQPTLSNLTATGNSVNGLVVPGGTLTANTTWAPIGLLRIPTGTITIPQGITLTIAPGVIVKPDLGGDFLVVNGTLKAEGTVAQPIIITSFSDDTAGGDTNNDGPSTGSNGQIGSIDFTATSTGSILDHVEVRYGRDSSSNLGMINVAGSALTISNSVVGNSSHAGIVALTGSMVTVTSSLILNDSGSGLQAEAGSTLIAINDTIDGNFRAVILDSPTATLTNDLITNSNDGLFQTGPTSLTLSFSDVFGNSNNYNGLADQTSTNGNTSVDPLYVDRPDGQYALRPGSPVEDAGTSVGAPTTDFLGNPRFKDPNIVGRGDGSGVDMGALEVQQGVSATSPIDLATSVVNGPATGLAGQAVTVTWTVADVGSSAATASWHDAVYLSATPTLTPASILLGEVPHKGALQPGQSYATPATGTFTLPGELPGTYFFVVLANSRNEVFEGTALANNVAASTAVAMDLPTLALNTPTAGQFTSAVPARYYKITVPAGDTLQVSLASTASTGTNELYLSQGALPTSSQFAAAFRGPIGPNQELILPTTQAATYYLLAQNVDNTAAAYTLTAQVLSFGISSVTPAQVGNGGQVTLEILGSQFVAPATATLTAPDGTVVTALGVSVHDAATLSATFDLTGKATGAYTLTVKDGQGVTTTAAGAVHVVAAVPSSLTVQLLSPAVVRQGRLFTAQLVVTNPGNSDVVMPLLYVDSHGAADLGFTPTDLQTQPLSVVPQASDNATGILGPGETWTLTIYGTPLPTSTGQVKLSLSQVTYSDAPMDATKIAALFPAAYVQSLGTQANQFQAVLNAISGPTQAEFLRSIHTAAAMMSANLAPGTSLRVEDVWNTELAAVVDLIQNHALDTYFQQLGLGASPAAATQAALTAPFSVAADLTDDGPRPPPVVTPIAGSQAGTVITTVWPGDPIVGVHHTRYITAGFVASETYAAADFPNQMADLLHCIYPGDTIKLINWNSGTIPKAGAFSAGGVAGGAAVGTFFFPGVGTLIGGGLGGLAGLGAAAGSYYAGSANLTPGVGADVAFDIQTKGDPSTTIIYGHSLGAHVAGYAGKKLHGQLQQIVAFDPAGELFGGPNDGLTPGAAKSTIGIFTSQTFGMLGSHHAFGRDPNTVTSQQYYPVVTTNNPVAQHAESYNQYIAKLQTLCNNNVMNMDPSLSDWSTTEPGSAPNNDSSDIDSILDPTLTEEETSAEVGPYDPNDLQGPAGFGSAGFLPAAANLPYTIEFANDPKHATAPAQVVTVTDQLDPHLDLSTFSLGSVGFGSTVVSVPAGRQSYSTSVDTTNPDGSALRVQLDASLNRATGLATWTFQSLDPATGLPPANPLAGFLPVDNLATHVGEGFVSYSVQAQAGLATGTTFNASAAVVFDTNAPLATNTVSNTLDSGAPTSTVTTLPAQSAATVPVSWSGHDNMGGSGITGFDIFVSDNNGPFTLWQSFPATQTSATYTGVGGHSYAFYSVATDHVGNRQPTPPTAQASTQVPFPSSITLTSDHGQGATYGQAVTITATVSATSGNPAGSVQFTVDGNAAGTPVTLANGSASIALPPLTAGSHSVSATFTSSVPTISGSTIATALQQVVTPAPLTITADSKKSFAGSALPPLTVSYSGFVNGDSAANLAPLPSVTTTAKTTSGAGTYAIFVSGAGDPNYSITFVPGVLTITAPPLQLVAPHQLKVKGLSVSFKGHLALSDTTAHAVLKVHLSTTLGKLHLHASGVKLTGNNSRAVTLTGSASAVNRALGTLSLVFTKAHSKAKVTVAVSDGKHSQQATIAIA